jgi:hypothetical protein
MASLVEMAMIVAVFFLAFIVDTSTDFFFAKVASYRFNFV